MGAGVLLARHIATLPRKLVRLEAVRRQALERGLASDSDGHFKALVLRNWADCMCAGNGNTLAPANCHTIGGCCHSYLLKIFDLHRDGRSGSWIGRLGGWMSLLLKIAAQSPRLVTRGTFNPFLRQPQVGYSAVSCLADTHRGLIVRKN